MNIETQKSRLNARTRLGGEFLGIKDLDSSFIINSLEESIKIREMPIDQRIRKAFNQKI